MNKENVDVTKNKAIYFILPMLQLNKSSFGADNFITCYLDKSGYIVVNTKYEVTENILAHKNYITDYQGKDGTMIVFSIPEEFTNDVPLFVSGKYSQLSSKLKVLIGKIPEVSPNILSMLNPKKSDLESMAHELGVDVKYIKEISSIPSDSNFIYIK